MDTMNVVLSENMKLYVQQQVDRGGYQSDSEYIRDLIRTDQRAKAREALEAEVRKGLRSGEAAPMAHETKQGIHLEIHKRHAELHYEPRSMGSIAK